MVVVPQQSKIKIEDDDEEDVEALRLAALKSLRKKAGVCRNPALSQVQRILPQVNQSSRFPYKSPWPTKKTFYNNRVQQKQNGVSVHLCIARVTERNSGLLSNDETQ